MAEALLCFPNQFLNALEPVTRAKFTDFIQVQFGVARDQFHNIGFGFMSAGIKF